MICLGKNGKFKRGHTGPDEADVAEKWIADGGEVYPVPPKNIKGEKWNGVQWRPDPDYIPPAPRLTSAELKAKVDKVTSIPEIKAVLNDILEALA